jgi:predicted HicB family RNase H-like nuclease
MVTNKSAVKDRYTYRVTWSEEDGEYIGLCAEFPSLSWLAATQEEALTGIKNMVSEVMADMKSHSEPVPEPISIKYYSGIFTVRTTPDVHREIAIKAAEANISINRYVCGKLNTSKD